MIISVMIVGGERCDRLGEWAHRLRGYWKVSCF